MAGWVKTSIEGWSMMLDLVAEFIVIAQTLDSTMSAVSITMNKAMGQSMEEQIDLLKDNAKAEEDYIARLKERQSQ